MPEMSRRVCQHVCEWVRGLWHDTYQSQKTGLGLSMMGDCWELSGQQLQSNREESISTPKSLLPIRARGNPGQRETTLHLLPHLL